MPGVFRAISPHYACQYFFSTGEVSWVSLNGILLCVSGSEALFADMGHFSHRAISVSVLSEDAFTLCDLGRMALQYVAEDVVLEMSPLHHSTRACSLKSLSCYERSMALASAWHQE